MGLTEILKAELANFPKIYSEREADSLRSRLIQEGIDFEAFFSGLTNLGFFIASSRVPINDKLRVSFSNYSLDGRKYLHAMKIPYFAFITALHGKLDFHAEVDLEKLMHYQSEFNLNLGEYHKRFSPNPNLSYLTDPDRPRSVTYVSSFIQEIMKISFEEYVERIRKEGFLPEGYIYVLDGKGMVPSTRYPKMEYNFFEDSPFLARIPISREKDWKYKSRIAVQLLSLSDLHIFH